MDAFVRLVAPFFFATALSVGGLLASPASASAIPFGGTVTLVKPCLGGGLTEAYIAEPPPLPTVLKVIAVPSPFLYYLIDHPGQHTLGNLGGISKCNLTPDDVLFAPLVYFYGTSI